MKRTAILSDIHGNLAALESVLEDVEAQTVDRIICLGDVIGYGPDPCACLDQVMSFDFCVLGNHDSSALFDPKGLTSPLSKRSFGPAPKLNVAATVLMRVCDGCSIYARCRASSKKNRIPRSPKPT